MTQLTPSGYEGIISELKATVQKWKDKHATLESLYHRALVEKGEAIAKFVGADQQRQAELEELKQWASDACELLHEIRGTVHDNHIGMFADRIVDLLRKLENP